MISPTLHTTMQSSNPNEKNPLLCVFDYSVKCHYDSQSLGPSALNVFSTRLLWSLKLMISKQCK